MLWIQLTLPSGDKVLTPVGTIEHVIENEPVGTEVVVNGSAMQVTEKYLSVCRALIGGGDRIVSVGTPPNYGSDVFQSTWKGEDEDAAK